MRNRPMFRAKPVTIIRSVLRATVLSSALISALTSALLTAQSAHAQTSQTALDTPMSTGSNIEPLRIISADLGSSQILQALELAPQIVAVDLTSINDPSFSKLPNIGYHRQLSPEGLLSIQADVLVGSSHMGPELSLATLRKTGTKIIRQQTPQTLSDLERNIQQLAMTFDQSDRGERVLERLRSKGSELNDIKLQSTSALFLLDMGGHKGSMAGENTSGAAFLGLLGLKNVATFTAYREASAESLIALNPDVIITASRSETDEHPDPSMTFNIPTIQMRADTLVAGLSLAAVDEAIRVKNLIRLQD